MVGKNYLVAQAKTLLNFARATTNPNVAAGLLKKAAELNEQIEAAPDLAPGAPDMKQAQA